MKPLQAWDSAPRGYRFKEPTWYTKYHLGVDHMVPSGTHLYAPFDGVVTDGSFPDGGVVINFHAKRYVFRFMHLSAILRKGEVKEGDLIATTGNTGNKSTGPHLHTDISKGEVRVKDIANFLDPETFPWETPNPQVTKEKPMKVLTVFRPDGRPEVLGLVHFETYEEIQKAGFPTTNIPLLQDISLEREEGKGEVYLRCHIPNFSISQALGLGPDRVQVRVPGSTEKKLEEIKKIVTS